LGKISGSYSLSVSGVAAANASTLAANNKVVSMAVTGDNATIVANLSDLHGLGKKVATITQSNPSTSLALSAEQWVGQASTLNKIVGGFSATLSGVSAAKAQTVAADSRVKSLQVKDNAANLSANIDSLQALGAPLSEIDQSDAAALNLTATQWGAVQGALGKYKTGTAPAVVVAPAPAAALAKGGKGGAKGAPVAVEAPPPPPPPPPLPQAAARPLCLPLRASRGRGCSSAKHARRLTWWHQRVPAGCCSSSAVRAGVTLRRRADSAIETCSSLPPRISPIFSAPTLQLSPLARRETDAVASARARWLPCGVWERARTTAPNQQVLWRTLLPDALTVRAGVTLRRSADSTIET
jgi:hypothetical protein